MLRFNEATGEYFKVTGSYSCRNTVYNILPLLLCVFMKSLSVLRFSFHFLLALCESVCLLDLTSLTFLHILQMLNIQCFAGSVLKTSQNTISIGAHLWSEHLLLHLAIVETAV